MTETSLPSTEIYANRFPFHLLTRPLLTAMRRWETYNNKSHGTTLQVQPLKFEPSIMDHMLWSSKYAWHIFITFQRGTVSSKNSANS